MFKTAFSWKHLPQELKHYCKITFLSLLWETVVTAYSVLFLSKGLKGENSQDTFGCELQKAAFNHYTTCQNQTIFSKALPIHPFFSPFPISPRCPFTHSFRPTSSFVSPQPSRKCFLSLCLYILVMSTA